MMCRLLSVFAGVQAHIICPEFVRAGEQRRFGYRIVTCVVADQLADLIAPFIGGSHLRRPAGWFRSRNLLTD
jgi:hypothetical protein